jgi:hypothetical protein
LSSDELFEESELHLNGLDMLSEMPFELADIEQPEMLTSDITTPATASFVSAGLKGLREKNDVSMLKFMNATSFGLLLEAV